MLKIRLKRTGRKNNPFYRIVLMENLSKRDGKAIAELGYYSPLTKEIKFDTLNLHKYIKKEPGSLITQLLITNAKIFTLMALNC